MRFTERELTLALEGAAKSVLGVQDKSVRKGRRSVDEAWRELTKFQRFTMLDGLGDQLLPAMISLPDIDVAPGTRPSFTDAQIKAAITERLGEVRGIKARVLLEGRVALLKVALAALPVRQDPDALIVPDHL